MKTLIVTIISLLALNSQANQMSAYHLSKIFYSAKCDVGCAQDVSVESFDAKTLLALPLQLQKSLYTVAYDQAQIWGDTILEGDYVADGRTRLDEVLVIKENMKVIGYAVSYSERAWYIGECAYTHRNPETLASCDEGRIYERSFVSLDLNDAEVDQNQFADFKPND